VNRKSFEACNFNCFIETEELLKVTGSHVISRKQFKMKTLLLQTTNRKSYMVYRIATFSITLNDLQGHSPIVSLLKCDFSNGCAAVHEMSANIARRAAPLR